MTAAPTPEPMLLTYKYRLNPTRRQHRALEAVLEQQRQLYNAALAERIESYQKSALVIIGQIRRDREIGVARIASADGTVRFVRRENMKPADLAALLKDEADILSGHKKIARGVTEVEQSRSLTIIRRNDPSFAAVQRRIQRETLRRLDRAYKAFFKRAKAGAGGASGFPMFKGFHYFDGFGFDAFQQVKWDGKRLRFDGSSGGIRVNLDRDIPRVMDPETGDLKTVSKGLWFKRDGRRWHCGFQAETPVRAGRGGMGKGDIGVDWGTSVLAALSSGEMIANPRHGETLAADLARAQRAVSRKKKGSKNRRKARAHMQAVSRKIANRRRNTLDKVSKRLVTHFRTVAIEDIAVKGMMDAERPGETLPTHVKKRRNREALDAAPYLLRQMLAYKAKRERADLIVVDAKHTTQECFWCGGLHFKELTDAVHVCTRPGLYFNKTVPRKVNAARVILKRALAEQSATDRDGLVPGGVVKTTNGGTGRRRPGNTGGRSDTQASGQRSALDLLNPTPKRRPERTSGW